MVAAAKGTDRRQLLNLVQSVSVRLCSYLTTYQLGKRGNVPMTGTLYVGSLLAEANPSRPGGKLRDFPGSMAIEAVELRRLWFESRLSSIPDASIDYIFIDPPLATT